jgi:chemosensory pili system protein ChpC
MRAPQRIEKKAAEVASLLIPMQDGVLLLPNVSVAEIVPISRVVPQENAPEWYLGNCDWREQTIPLLSYEVLNGDPKVGVNSRSRIAVLNTTGLNESLPFIAILTQGLPRLARVTEDELTQRDDSDNKAVELMHVSWAGEEAVIPDITAIEQTFLNYLESE